MGFNFERHTETRRSFIPKASLSPNGLLGFSDAAIKLNGLKDFKYVVLYYDKVNKVIGIQPTNDEKEPGVMKFRHRDQGAYVAAKSFVGKFGITLEGTTSFDVDRDADSGYLIVDLKRGRLRNSGSKSDGGTDSLEDDTDQLELDAEEDGK